MKIKLNKPDTPVGYSVEYLRKVLDQDEFQRLSDFLEGRTGCFYEDKMVVYTQDVEKFLRKEKERG